MRLQGIVSILDQQHVQIVENLWAEMRTQLGIAPPRRHNSATRVLPRR